MAVARVPITPEVLTWARERAGYSPESLAAKAADFKKVAEWESGESRPTYRQLEKLASVLWVPVLAFFLPEAPDYPKVQETFRTLDSVHYAEVPPHIRRLLHKAEGFQGGLEELNNGRNPARRHILKDLSIEALPLAEAAAQIRAFLGVSLRQQYDMNDHAQALKHWRSALFAVGVSVFKDAFKDDDYCGFCLYDDEFPIIYVNNSNPPTRQTFTLFHELAHLLYKTSGVDRRAEFGNPLAPDHARLEQRCNALANAVLVPAHALTNEFCDTSDLKREAERLANLFKVSREVIYRNFLDRKMISSGEYADATANWISQLRSGRKGGGGNYYRTKIAYLGEEYISLAFDRFEEERIDEEELADYLAIKPKHIERLEDELYAALA